MANKRNVQVEVVQGSIVEDGKFQNLRRSFYFGVNKAKDRMHSLTKRRSFIFANIHLDTPDSLLSETGIVKSSKDGIIEVYMHARFIDTSDSYWYRYRFIEFDDYPFDFPYQTPEINALYKQNTEYELQRGFARNMNLPLVKIIAIKRLQKNFQEYYNYVITYQLV